LIQPSRLNVLPTSRLLESGTRTLSSTPSIETAWLSTPGTPSVGPPRYVPWLRNVEESVAIVPDVSSKCQQPRTASVTSHAAGPASGTKFAEMLARCLVPPVKAPA
jgi:hypothetical protein